MDGTSTSWVVNMGLGENPCKFLSDETGSICSIGVTLVDLWMRTGHQKDQVMIRILEHSALPHIFSERGEGLKIKLSKVQVLESF